MREKEARLLAKKSGVTDKMEFSTVAEDAARAAALSVGAGLVYKALIFGSTLCPPARPAAQGLMILLGITPAEPMY